MKLFVALIIFCTAFGPSVSSYLKVSKHENSRLSLLSVCFCFHHLCHRLYENNTKIRLFCLQQSFQWWILRCDYFVWNLVKLNRSKIQTEQWRLWNVLRWSMTLRSEVIATNCQTENKWNSRCIFVHLIAENLEIRWFVVSVRTKSASSGNNNS